MILFTISNIISLYLTENMSTITQIMGKDDYIKAELDTKAKELNIIGRSKMTKDKLAKAITDAINNKPIKKQKKIPNDTNAKTKTLIKTTKKTTKQKIAHVAKNKVWDKYIGKEKGIGECYCCKKEIDSKHFECGHIVAEANGGSMEIDNLRPVCDECNKSIGTQNMNNFIDKYKINKKPNECDKYCHCVSNPMDNSYASMVGTCTLCSKTLRYNGFIIVHNCS